MNQPGIGTEAAREIIDRLIAPHCFGKPASAIFLGGVFRKLAFVIGLKRDAFFIHLLQITSDFRCVDAGIKIGEIPFRQFAGLADGFGFRRRLGGWFALRGGFAESG